MPPSESSPYRLLVEGSDDLHSIANLMARHGIEWENPDIALPYIHSVGGIEELLRTTPVAVKASYDRVGIVLDADLNLADRWNRLRGRLVAEGLHLPAAPEAEGIVIDGIRSGSRVGIWVMPNNVTPGRLEDFLEKLIPADDPCWAFAAKVTKQAARQGCTIVDELKSSIHAWLAWQQEPGLPFGTALRARLFRHDSSEAVRFVGWFRRLFS